MLLLSSILLSHFIIWRKNKIVQHQTELPKLVHITKSLYLLAFFCCTDECSESGRVHFTLEYLGITAKFSVHLADGFRNGSGIFGTATNRLAEINDRPGTTERMEESCHEYELYTPFLLPWPHYLQVA
jgi:hypothetical protein